MKREKLLKLLKSPPKFILGEGLVLKFLGFRDTRNDGAYKLDYVYKCVSKGHGKAYLTQADIPKLKCANKFIGFIDVSSRLIAFDVYNDERVWKKQLWRVK